MGKVRLKLAFTLFDLTGKNVINKRDIGTLIRYLGHFPSEQDMKQRVLPQLNEILKQNRSALNLNMKLSEDLKLNDEAESDANSNSNSKATNSKETAPQNENEIDFATFELIMLEIMKQNMFPRDDEETLLSAFKVIQNHFKRHNASSSGSEQSEDEEEHDDDGDEEEKVVFKNDIIAAMQNFGDEFCLDSRELDEFLNIAIITTNKNNKKINEKAAKHKGKDAQANEVIYYEDYVDELYFQLTNHA